MSIKKWIKSTYQGVNYLKIEIKAEVKSKEKMEYIYKDMIDLGAFDIKTIIIRDDIWLIGVIVVRKDIPGFLDLLKEDGWWFKQLD